MGKVKSSPSSNPASGAPALSSASISAAATTVKFIMERKKLGEQLARPVLEAVNFDLKHTVFLYSQHRRSRLLRV
jgi:hypothetical protein